MIYLTEHTANFTVYTAEKSVQMMNYTLLSFDEDGEITGTKVRVLENLKQFQKPSDAKTPQGSVNYYPDVIYTKSSNYIFWMDYNLHSNSKLQCP